MFSQFPERPREQKKQVPQEMLKGTTTRSPLEVADGGAGLLDGAGELVAEGVADAGVGDEPVERCRSEPQMAARVTLSTTSLECSILGSGLLTTGQLVGSLVAERSHVFLRRFARDVIRTQSRGADREARRQPRPLAR